jgi:hypothetical protein
MSPAGDHLGFSIGPKSNGCQVMAIAHMTLWVRWAKKASVSVFKHEQESWESLEINSSLIEQEYHHNSFRNKCTFKHFKISIINYML